LASQDPCRPGQGHPMGLKSHRKDQRPFTVADLWRHRKGHPRRHRHGTASGQFRYGGIAVSGNNPERGDHRRAHPPGTPLPSGICPQHGPAAGTHLRRRRGRPSSRPRFQGDCIWRQRTCSHGSASSYRWPFPCSSRPSDIRIPWPWPWSPEVSGPTHPGVSSMSRKWAGGTGWCFWFC